MKNSRHLRTRWGSYGTRVRLCSRVKARVSAHAPGARKAKSGLVETGPTVLVTTALHQPFCIRVYVPADF